MVTPNARKLAVKFKLTEADVVQLLKAGHNTPVKVRAAAKDDKLPGALSAEAKAALEGRWKKD